jgi:hypothetical protein
VVHRAVGTSLSSRRDDRVVVVFVGSAGTDERPRCAHL